MSLTEGSHSTFFITDTPIWCSTESPMCWLARANARRNASKGYQASGCTTTMPSGPFSPIPSASRIWLAMDLNWPNACTSPSTLRPDTSMPLNSLNGIIAARILSTCSSGLR